MKQKLALAATLIHEPDLIFLDEPTTGVDPVSRREFWRIISELHSRGITVLVATPYMDEAERCREIAFLEKGRILVRDTPAGLKARVPGRLFEVSVDDYQGAVQTLRGLPGVLVRRPVRRARPGRLGARRRARTPRRSARHWKDAGIRPRLVRESPVSMETAFSMLVKREGEGTEAVLLSSDTDV